jgi:hypothetical protein
VTKTILVTGPTGKVDGAPDGGVERVVLLSSYAIDQAPPEYPLHRIERANAVISQLSSEEQAETVTPPASTSMALLGKTRQTTNER